MSQILWFKDCHYGNTSLIGGKNASLGKLINFNTSLFSSANGFAITTQFYDEFVEYNKLNDKIMSLLEGVDISNIKQLNKIAKSIKSLFYKSIISHQQNNILLDEYYKINQLYSHTIQLAVRSSAIAEDMPNASFAGQQDTYLNICNFEEFKTAVINCYASLFNINAISYRVTNKIEFDQVKMSIAVQKMIRSDLSIAGVAFSIDPQSGYKNCITINSAYGLGEGVVSGMVNPDEILVDKRFLTDDNNNYDPILDIKVGDKKTKVVYQEKVSGTKEVKNLYLNKSVSISDDQIREIALAVDYLEKYYKKEYHDEVAIDVEWAYDGLDNRLYILQARAETIHSNNDNQHTLKIVNYELIRHKNDCLKLLTRGIAIGSKISSGKIVLAKNLSDALEIFNQDDVLVTDMTTPDWEPIMKKSSGIITNKGSKTCHAAIIARELNINAVVGCINATDVLQSYLGKDVTIDCSNGDIGCIYYGELEFKEVITEIDREKVMSKNLNIMMNIGNPEIAFKSSFLPHKGVGLTRLEFIINDHIKVHPNVLLDYQSLPELVKKDIDMIILKDNPIDYFIKKLSRGVAQIASAVYPEKIIVRFSDFKSNEYKNLIGGATYEPEEENPMIGWRGACRYYSKEYEKAFRLECRGIRYARERMGLNNIIVMIPFCRTPEECKKIVEIMKEEKLERGVNGLEVYIMCEIPSNVLEADLFSPYIDGVSIGGNDLLQLTLGIDRDSPYVEHIASDKNVSYRRFISMAIKTYKKYGIKVGFCGQQPSNSIEFAQFLLNEGIDTISVTPNSIIQVLNNLQ